jgi:ABC-type dipeptide/oligopeptide/nickel transport systems, permease components
VTPEAIERWKVEHGYDKPLLLNAQASGSARFTDTIFFQHSVSMFAFKFGNGDDGRNISNEIRTRMWPSLAIALPVFVIGLLVNITFALLMVFFRTTYLDLWGVVLCVVLMSISFLFYIITGQYFIAKLWNLLPISGYAGGIDGFRFILLPVLVGVVAGIGSGSRWYRTIFLEEIGKDMCVPHVPKACPRFGYCSVTC